MEKYTTQELISELNRIKILLGHLPNSMDITRNSHISSSTFLYRFGKTWKLVLSQIANDNELSEYGFSKGIIY